MEKFFVHSMAISACYCSINPYSIKVLLGAKGDVEVRWRLVMDFIIAMHVDMTSASNAWIKQILKSSITVVKLTKFTHARSNVQNKKK